MEKETEKEQKEEKKKKKKLHSEQAKKPTQHHPWPLFHLQTLYLFTLSDFKTVVFPTMTFALCSSLASAPNPTLFILTTRLPSAALWTWSTLLMENIANQRLPHYILEDSLNKPWRPIPAQRISPQLSRCLLLYLVVPLTGLLSWSLGVLRQFAALAVFTWMYNDLGGSSEGWHVRNALNAVALCTFFAGATAVVAVESGEEMTEQTWRWVVVIGCVIATTVQVQDLGDMEGDAAAGRRTMPLVFGETVIRWGTAVLVGAWSVVCPGIWGVDGMGYVTPVGVGWLLAVRVECGCGQAVVEAVVWVDDGVVHAAGV
ncbi:MAG: hypothetical protein Q9210_007441 [Variospora velana]